MIKQSLEVIRLNIMALPQRLGTSVISVIGIACVVGVFVGIFSIGETFTAILQSSVDADTVLIMSEDADFEGNSSLDRNAVNVISTSSYVRVDGDGPLASFEFTRSISVTRKEADDFVTVNVRGVSPPAYRLRSGFELVEGRVLEAGRFELIVGRAAQEQFAGLEIGDTVMIAATPWEVVGVFENDGAAIESELWGDISNLQSVFRTGNVVQSGRVKLNDIADLAAFTEQVNSDPQVQINTRLESQYIEESSSGFLQIVSLLGMPLIVIMALGAIFAALNTMYNSVASRTREIATLRAIGFRALPVAVSVFFESLLLSLAGAILGVAVIYSVLNGYTTNTNFLSNTQYAFSFVITPPLMLQGILCALVIGFFGGLLPAFRAGRMSIIVALRES
jgi:putative ABC transport system permease protein